MFNVETFKVFQARDVFGAIRKRYGEDVEGKFNEIFCPPADGAILFTIPSTNEEWDDEEIYVKYVADVLMQEGGLTWGDTCYIHFDY